jgi:hypothetical protein
LGREVVEKQDDIEDLGEIYDDNSGQFFEDFTGNEVIARGFFGLRWLMTAWISALVKRGLLLFLGYY